MSTLAAHRKRAILNYLITNQTELRELPRAELREVCQEWLKQFAARVKRQEGFWILKGFKWHGFSYGIECCLSGETALHAYQSTKGRFYVFDEGESFGLLCKTAFPLRPDFSQFRTDVYVTARDFSWTMVFTHEQPEIGPFFAESVTRTSGR